MNEPAEPEFTQQQQFGAYLRRERELRRIDLDYVARSVRLSHDRLVELESGNWGKFGAAVYVRGAVSSYARAIGLDVDDTLLRLDSDIAELEPFGESLFNKDSPVFRTEPDPSLVNPWKRRIPVFLVIIAVGVMAWVAFRKEISKHHFNTQVPGPEVETTAAPMALTSPTPATEPAALENTSPTEETQRAPTPPLKRIVVNAWDESWLEYATDGQDRRDIILRAGEQIALEATREVFLRSGNAGGVTITVDGIKAAPLGQTGVVRQRLLTFE